MQMFLIHCNAICKFLSQTQVHTCKKSNFWQSQECVRHVWHLFDLFIVNCHKNEPIEVRGQLHDGKIVFPTNYYLNTVLHHVQNRNYHTRSIAANLASVLTRALGGEVYNLDVPQEVNNIKSTCCRGPDPKWKPKSTYSSDLAISGTIHVLCDMF